MERELLLNDEVRSNRLFVGPPKLILFIFGGLTAIASLSFFTWACVKIWAEAEGYNLGCLVFVFEFLAGLSCVYAAIRRSRVMTVAAQGFILLGTSATTVGYGAGDNPIFSDPKYIGPMYSWIAVGIILSLAAGSAAHYDKVVRRIPMFPVVVLNLVISLFVVVGSAAFFTWAQYNTISANKLKPDGSDATKSGNFDVGIICFFISAVAGLTGLYAAGDRTPLFGIFQIFWATLALVAVLLGYGAGFAYTIEDSSASEENKITHYKHLGIGAGIWVVGLVIALTVAIISFRQVRYSEKEAFSRFPM